jgi:23S rRNA-/tRNA-specific pseudouridylate synthase
MEVLYEDHDVVAICKPAGLLSHPNRDASEDSVETRLAKSLGTAPVLFHRLDRDSTGVMLIGKSRKWNREFRELFDQHRIRKAYWVVVEGLWPGYLTRLEGVDKEGKDMLSTCRVLNPSTEWTLLEILLKTGRQHQIRIQCADQKHPVIGDSIYGNGGAVGLALHCRELRFIHPADQKERRIEAPLPGHWMPEWSSLK